MSLENEQIVQNQPANPITPEMQNAFVKNMWGEDAAPTPPPVSDTPPVATPPSTDPPPPVEIPVPTDWLKKEFDIDDFSVLKAEREELKTLKANPIKEEIKFNDDQSKQIYEYLREGGDKKKEVLKFLATQDKLENLVNAEVNENTAEDIIKLGLKLKHKDLTDSEINYKFNKSYSLPKEPVQGDTEDDEVFAERKQTWQEQVEDIKISKIIDAKTMKPDLEKAKSELVLPEINKGAAVRKEPTPEELAAFNQTKDSFLQSAKQKVETFNGFTAQVKDKDVDYSVTYAPSQEEKVLISEKLTKLAESGFDVNELFAERWYDNDTKTFKIDQMTEDLSRIFMGKNSDQKLAVESANKRMEVFLKEKKNVSVNEGNKGSTFQPNGTQTPSEKLAEKFFA